MSMADHGSLSHLDLSYNNLSGKTPSSNQLFSCNLASCGSAYHRDMPWRGYCLIKVHQPIMTAKTTKKMLMNSSNGFETGFGACLGGGGGC
jgi:hypothetical protein